MTESLRHDPAMSTIDNKERCEKGNQFEKC
jgi:hypothetical protein